LSGYIGSYELLKKLGEGNFGAVYAAVGEVPGRGLNAGRRRLVAVKQLKHNADEHSKDLLVQEFGLLDQVRNRSIVRVFEYIPNENAVAMEYIHGVTLSKMLEELKDAREQVFTEAAIEIACEIADALYQAWTTPGDNGEPLRLVHRDLKPENIMLTPSGEVKILDFGLAHVDNADFARDDPERLKGTPIYMAPEQARGDSVDHRTDLFALGLMTYELLMNQAAYRVPANSRDPLGDIFDAIERGALLDQCRELESKLPGVGPVLTRLLQPNPRSRYQDGQGLLVDLRRQLYKDRGSYLKEFCEFFFGAIYDLPAPPDMDAAGDLNIGGGAAPVSSADAFKQRVQASMARGGNTPDRGGGRAQAFNPTKSKAAVQRGRPRADLKGPGAPKPRGSSPPPRSAPPPRGTGGRPPGGGRSGGSPAPRRGGLEPIKPRKILGARSPDETGMLPLMDLSDAVGQEEEPSTATAFFAIPAPKAKARDNRAAPAPTPQSAPQRSAPPGATSSGSRPGGAPPPFQPPQQPGFSPPPAAQPPGGGFGAPPGNAYTSNQGMPPGIAPAPIGISGPVAAGPVAGQGYAAPPPPAANDPKRTSSNRIYAVVLGLVLLMGVSTAATVWWVINKDDGVEPIADTIDYEPRERPTREVAEADDEEDEEIEEELPDENSWKPPPTYTGGGGAAVAAPPPEPVKPSGAGPLTVILTGDGGGVTGFQLACPSGYNKRAGLGGGAASFADVPEESCTLTTRGAKSGAFQGATAHMTLTCSFDGGAFNCF